MKLSNKLGKDKLPSCVSCKHVSWHRLEGFCLLAPSFRTVYKIMMARLHYIILPKEMSLMLISTTRMTLLIINKYSSLHDQARF